MSNYPVHKSESLGVKYPIFKNCDAIRERQSFFRMEPPYKVGRKNTKKYPERTEHDIMYEIQFQGPVQGKFNRQHTTFKNARSTKSVSRFQMGL